MSFPLHHPVLNHLNYMRSYDNRSESEDDDDEDEEDKKTCFLPIFYIILFLILYFIISMTGIRNSSNNKHEVSRLNIIPAEFYQRQALETSSSSSETFEISVGSQRYNYPSMVDMLDLVERVKTNRTVPLARLHQPVDWMINNSNLCQSSSESMELLILVRSDPMRVDNRQAIRDTWGRRECYFGRFGKVQRLFIMEQPAPNIQANKTELLLEEAKLHHDIAVIQFHDNCTMHRTRLLIASLDWTNLFCNRARHTLIVDDNYFLQPGRIAELLRTLSDYQRNRLVAGYVVNYELPVRELRSGVSISRQIYPDEIYPPYLANGAMLLAREMAADLAIAAHYVKMFPLEEIFLALVMNKLLLMPHHLIEFVAKPQRQNLSRVFTEDVRFRHIFLSHGYEKAETLRLAWRHPNAQRGYCSRRTRNLNRAFMQPLIKIS